MIQTINFKKFMENDWREDKLVNSILPVPTGAMFFNEPVGLLLGLGVVVVSLTVLEKYLVKTGRESYAELISLVLGSGLPAVAIGGSLYVVLKASQLFL